MKEISSINTPLSCIVLGAQVEQIVEILNHHLDSLQWLDSNATQLENRYARVEDGGTSGIG